MSDRLGFTRKFQSPDMAAKVRLNGLSIPPGRSDIAAQAPMQRIVYPPRIEKLLTSQDFNVSEWAMTLPAGAGSTVVSTIAVFEAPASMVGWLQNFSLYLLTPTAATTVSFAIRINQGPVPGFDNYQNSPGVANLYREDYNDIRVRIPMGGVVDVLVTNLGAGGPWTVGCRLAGWYHSSADELRVYGDEY